MATTRAQQNRAIRQEALREQLAKQKHVEHVIELIKKMESPDSKVEGAEYQRLKLAIETRLALIKKYLPDLKQTELVGDGGEPLSIQIVRFTDAPAQ